MSVCISFSYKPSGFFYNSPYSEAAVVFLGAEHLEVILGSAEKSAMLWRYGMALCQMP